MSRSEPSQRWRSVLSTSSSNAGDLVTALDFDEEGQNLAVGDKSGHIRLFQEQKSGAYELAFRFKSHAPTLDCLKSLEIEERINTVKFVRGHSSGTFLLSANDKVVKLWRVQKKRGRRHTNSPIRMRDHLLARAGSPRLASREGQSDGVAAPPPLSLRRPLSDAKSQSPARGAGGGPGGGDAVQSPEGRTSLRKTAQEMKATCKREYGEAHAYHIHSISMNSDRETFMSSDCFCVNLWRLQGGARNAIIDIKPKDMGSLTEIITSGTFHPDECNTLMYSTSRGRVCLHDLRSSAHLKEPAKNFEIAEAAYLTKHFFSEVLTSISDAKFTNDGRYVLTRDYLSLRLWDLNMERAPVEVFPVQPFLNKNLIELYQNNALFDKFQCASSPDGKRFATGSYSGRLVIHDAKRKMTPLVLTAPEGQSKSVSVTQGLETFDYAKTDVNRKALLCAWNPKKDVVAVSGVDRVDVYARVL